MKPSNISKPSMDINALLANAPDTVPQDEHETAFDWDNAVISHSYTELKSKLGRPISDNPKQAVSIRFDSDVLAYFKARGKGWQTAMNNVLREYIATHQA